ncbi:hypothetical protein K491DRAFT_619298 [Lophiostoma macrostomum CBS 122681]|uniref:AMMECR1 domain-containing protein n=1 Tax=Lophiostoma macrostomum CBS 122681 TaxID=1314788 RepID=A0A6A6TRR5_9PLEO|nr:hypothetical protein K491DRAFT_619298 [Lophiostoma macrostomum CBS 122681]
MATQAHCAYCFESLSASLEKRVPLSLHKVESLWKKHSADPTEEQPAENAHASPATNDASYRPAAVSRLLAPSPSTTSSSSVQSTREEAAEEEAVDDHPLFVTWNVVPKQGGEKRLRGCIGTFEAQELDDGLRSYALTSAFDDSRFPPITARELPTLECGVTLLTDFEPIASPLDWAIGTHGLRISFTYHGRRYGSTYLPDVAKEQGWSKEETMVSLMRKAGWSGRKDDWRKVELHVVRYQGKQVRLRYPEWREWRDWVAEAAGKV